MKLEIKDVSKSYDGGKHYALSHFSQTLKPGIYGLLGPNGAGKSTLMNILTQNLPADGGQVLWYGTPTGKLGREYRRRIGYMPQQQNLYDDFTGDEFLWYMAALKGLKRPMARRRIEELFRTVNLENARYRKVGGYSGGMKQRLLIAQALLNDPDILIMDEPTAGLDPKERIRIRSFISEMSTGKIVLFATHVISDIEFIAGRIILLGGGKIIEEGTPVELLELLVGKVFEGYGTREDAETLEREGILISGLSYMGESVRIRVISDKSPSARLDFLPVTPNLEDVYLYFEREG